MTCTIRSVLPFAVFVLALAPYAAADTFDVIVCGSGGVEEYRTKFADWGARLREVLLTKFGRTDANVYLLQESVPEERAHLRTSTKENVAGVLGQVAQRATEEDTVFIYLIGHGNYMRTTSMFIVPGRDMTAEDLDEWIAPIPASTIAIINSTAASAGFVNVLSGEGRIVASATKSVDEVNATEFMEFFIQGLEDGSADQNRDERISVLEACQQAADLTKTWYMGEGLIATEHALLDDNGDGLGSRLPILETGEGPFAPDEEGDGPVAMACYVKNFTFPPEVPRELVDEYLGHLNAVDGLRARKSDYEETEYYAQLEELLLRAARTHREIRRLSNAPETDPDEAIQRAIRVDIDLLAGELR